MLTGRIWPFIGGSPDLIDIVGLNYYPHNQWTPQRETIRAGDPLYRPLSDLITSAYARYGKPVFLSETGTEGEGRGTWLSQVMGEVLHARARGVPVEGICLYPIADHVAWDDNRICPNGLLGHLPFPRGRLVHQPLAEALAIARQDLDLSLGVSRPRPRAVSVG